VQLVPLRAKVACSITTRQISVPVKHCHQHNAYACKTKTVSTHTHTRSQNKDCAHIHTCACKCSHASARTQTNTHTCTFTHAHCARPRTLLYAPVCPTLSLRYCSKSLSQEKCGLGSSSEARAGRSGEVPLERDVLTKCTPAHRRGSGSEPPCMHACRSAAQCAAPPGPLRHLSTTCKLTIHINPAPGCRPVRVLPASVWT